MPPRRLPIGAEIATAEQGVHVRVWAPTHPRVTLVIEAPERRELVLAREPSGHHSGFAPGLAAGARYRFRLGDAPQLLPDPASRYQPEGPMGPSQVVDPAAFAWTDAGWRGIAPHRHVLYELHTGTFTPEGTWAAAAEQLPFLAELGITTIELMPVGEFGGRHGWGYDGVDLFAPHHHHGTPDDLRRLVDRAHALGLCVILDVVYNHFGPAGNVMFQWSPHYKAAHDTEWGEAIAFSGPHSAGVRELFITNAGYWISEFHFDGLRLDATQSIKDESPEHVISAIVRHARAAAPERKIWVVAENEPQDTALLGMGVDALWNDDFHHTARVALTGVVEGYLHDYRGTPQEFVSAVRHGFLYQGQLYPWQRNPRGTSTRGFQPVRFVQYLENHDQAANLGFGERLADVADAPLLRALTAVMLLSPCIPLLFQGQETGSRRRWQFFADHGEELHAAIRTGRAKFMAQSPRLATPEAQAALPDPCDPATFHACVLDPAERTFDNPYVRLHRDLLTLRRDDPAFTGAIDGAVLGPETFVLRFAQPDPTDDRLLLVNLGRRFAEPVVPEPLIAPPARHGWRLVWSSEDPRYGGHGTPRVFDRVRLSIPARAAVLLVPDEAESLVLDPPPPSGDHEPVEP